MNTSLHLRPKRKTQTPSGLLSLNKHPRLCRGVAADAKPAGTSAFPGRHGSPPTVSTLKPSAGSARHVRPTVAIAEGGPAASPRWTPRLVRHCVASSSRPATQGRATPGRSGRGAPRAGLGGGRSPGLWPRPGPHRQACQPLRVPPALPVGAAGSALTRVTPSPPVCAPGAPPGLPPLPPGSQRVPSPGKPGPEPQEATVWDSVRSHPVGSRASASQLGPRQGSAPGITISHIRRDLGPWTACGVTRGPDASAGPGPGARCSGAQRGGRGCPPPHSSVEQRPPLDFRAPPRTDAEAVPNLGHRGTPKVKGRLSYPVFMKKMVVFIFSLLKGRNRFLTLEPSPQPGRPGTRCARCWPDRLHCTTFAEGWKLARILRPSCGFSPSILRLALLAGPRHCTPV